MIVIDFKRPIAISSSSTFKEEDLESSPWPNRNTPSEPECDWCRRNLSELKPFGPPRDRLEDVTLFRLWRPEIQPNEKNNKILKEVFESCSDYQELWKKLVDKYGEEQAQHITMNDQLSSMWGTGYLCAECIISYFGEDYLQQIKQYLLDMDKLYAEVPF